MERNVVLFLVKYGWVEDGVPGRGHCQIELEQLQNENSFLVQVCPL